MSGKGWQDAMDGLDADAGTQAWREEEDDEIAPPHYAPCASQQTGSAPVPSPPPPTHMRPSDYQDSEGGPGKRRTYLPGVHSSAEPDTDPAEEAQAREMPDFPRGFAASGVMTVEEAYTFLGVDTADRGDLEKLKARFRKMCLRWHPDKNRGREKHAAEAFQAVHAAYHFLTTQSFDYKRWKASFTVPPLQTLEEVLLLALGGAEPLDVEALLRRRGEFRPHKDFGVNLSIPWVAGSEEEPSYEVAAGSVYTSTQYLEERSPCELGCSRAECGGRGWEAAGRVVAGCAVSGCAASGCTATALDEIGRGCARLDATALDEIGRDWTRLDASDAAEAGRAAGRPLVACGDGGGGGACGSSSASGAGAVKELGMGMGGDITLDPHLAPSSPQTPEAAAAIAASRELIRAAKEVCEAL